MIQTLDPHSSTDADMLKQVEVETKGAFGGLGIEIGMKDGYLTVIAPIEDTPAARAAFRPETDRPDRERVHQEHERDGRGEATPREPVPRSRSRSCGNRPRTRKPTRSRGHHQDSIRPGEVPRDGIGYIRLAQFQQDSHAELERAVQGFLKERAA